MDSKKIDRNFIIAHLREARPIIEFYGLIKNTAHHAFPVYENSDTRLVVSGQGKVASAAATVYCDDRQSAAVRGSMWVNVGVAGHASHPIGSLWRVNKVIDCATGSVIFPLTIQPHTDLFSDAVITVDRPEREYQQAGLYDMEASGFFQAAVRFTSIEYINSFKIISDNSRHPAEQLDAEKVTALMTKHLGDIDLWLHQLEQKLLTIDSHGKFNDEDFKTELYERLRFTYAQRRMCDELLHSLSVHGVHRPQALQQYNRASQVIQALSRRLNQIQLDFHHIH